MANASIIARKEQLVNELSEKLQKAQSVVVFDYRGLTVAEVTELRSAMRKAGNEYVVVKNSMVERAAEKVGIDESVKEMLKGPSAFAIGYEDAVSPAKILKDTVKKLKKCEIKGGIVNGKVADAAAIDALAELPPKEVLIARMLGSMMSPISGLVIVLDQIAKKNGGETAEAQAE